MWTYNMNKKLYPTNWKAVVEIINNIKSLQLLEQQPTINMSTATFSYLSNIVSALLSQKNGIDKDTMKWVKTQMKFFEKSLHLEHQIIRDNTFYGIITCINNINWAIKEIDKAF